MGKNKEGTWWRESDLGEGLYPSTESEMRIVSYVNTKRPTLAIVGAGKEPEGFKLQESFQVWGYNGHRWKIASVGVCVSILTFWFTSSSDIWSGIPSAWYNTPEKLHMQHSVFPPSWAPQGDALEQGHHPEGICGLHPQITKGTATLQRPGEPAAIPGASQPKSAAPNSGLGGEKGEGDCNFQQVEAE